LRSDRPLLLQGGDLFRPIAQKILQDDCPNLYAYAIQDIYAISKKIDWTPRTDEMIWYKEMALA